LVKNLNANISVANLISNFSQATKIHKVLRGIMKVDYVIPLEDKYNFKKRSEVLHKKWMTLLAAAVAGEKSGKGDKSGSAVMEKATTAKENGVAEGESAATNGDAKEAVKGSASPKHENSAMAATSRQDASDVTTVTKTASKLALEESGDMKEVAGSASAAGDDKDAPAKT
jgi:hypothetical protein